MNYKSSGKQSRGSVCARLCVCTRSSKSLNPLLSPAFNKCLKMDDKPSDRYKERREKKPCCTRSLGEWHWFIRQHERQTCTKNASGTFQPFSLLVAHFNLAELAGKRCDTDRPIRNGAVSGRHAQQTHQFVFIWSKPSAFSYAKQTSLMKTVTDVCTPECWQVKVH